MRPSKNARRRLLALLLVHLLIAIHIGHWLLKGVTLAPVELSEAMQFSSRGLVNPGLLLFLAAILATAVFGRWFCGWGCHMVALQELSRYALLKLGIRPMSLRSRAMLAVPLAAFAYMFLWPLVERLAREATLEPRGLRLTTSDFWASFPSWPIALLTFVVCGCATVYVLGTKGFCTYACPYGAIFRLVGRAAPFKIRLSDACDGCGYCTAVCGSNVAVLAELRAFGAVVDPGCIKCLNCVSICPQDALHYGRRAPGSVTRRRRRRLEPVAGGCRWWEEVLLLLFFGLALATFRGLYSRLPFLFSLGWSAILAFLALTTLRMTYRRHLEFHRWGLVASGKLQRAGWVFLLAVAPLALLWLHSGWIRFHERRAHRLYLESAAIRPSWAAALADPPGLDPEQAALVVQAIGHWRTAEAWGLVRHAASDRELAWLYLLQGRDDLLRPRLERLMVEQPANGALRADYGAYLLRRSRVLESIPILRAATELDPGLIGAQLDLASSLTLAGDLDGARRVSRLARGHRRRDVADQQVAR